MKVVRSEVKQVTTAIEKSQQFLSDKFDGIVTDYQELKRENENLKLEVDRLKQTQHAMSKLVYKLEHNVDKYARQAISNNAIVFGVPYCPEENTLEIVHKIVTCYGLNVSSDVFVSADRLGGKNKPINSLVPIRVIFKNGDANEILFAKKNELGKLLSSSVKESLVVNGQPTSIVIRDELTPLSLELLSEMREYQEKLMIKYVWSSRGGNILVKKTSTQSRK
jgi:cell division protein FtsB